MKLDVPLVRQPKDSVDCGVAVLNMITKYHGLDISYSGIRSKIRVFKDGTYCPQLGSLLIRLGFNVELVTFNPALFTLKDVGKTQGEVVRHLQNLLETKKPTTDKRVIRFLLTFIKNGGVVTVKIPSEEDIKEEIESRRPLIVVLTSNFLVTSKPKFNLHFNVVTGIDEKYVYANDPAWDERGGKHKYLIPDYFYGIYASAKDPDNPTFIKIRKSK